MDTGFWLGIIFAVPLAIVANLLTPRIQGWLASRGETKLAQRHSKLRSEYERVRELKKDHLALNSFLITAVLEATFVSSCVGIVVGMIFGVKFLVGLGAVFVAAGQFFAASGAVVVAQICIEAIRISNRTRKFQEYKQRVEQELGETLES